MRPGGVARSSAEQPLSGMETSQAKPVKRNQSSETHQANRKKGNAKRETPGDHSKNKAAGMMDPGGLDFLPDRRQRLVAAV